MISNRVRPVSLLRWTEAGSAGGWDSAMPTAGSPAGPAVGDGGLAGGADDPANGSGRRARSADSAQEAGGACGSGANRSTALPSGSRTSA